MEKKKKIRCPECKGKGYTNRPVRVLCHNCGGAKWIYVKEGKPKV